MSLETPNIDSKSKIDSTELKVQRSIRQAEDEIVTAIQTALDECQYGKSGRDILEESQFRNLVRVSDTTDSAEVIKNFLRYQVGRDTKWGRGDQSLATRIISDIDVRIKAIAQAIANTTKSGDFKPIHLELIRRYLGYGARHLKYLRDGKTAPSN
ncbi:hypothetical protein APA_1294 [Pseudanabaena sp. lw0831]|uniref:hypothetical protein n=1 Tax=Pseudanabaena sp. lw0831 TaxID=1357935 RepID=UPI0019159CAA|nr:hypothetical protein [Pseudanabaena sp. lw0831]GBO53387.1 hypothetical protein APA_1294 [Pseudanabaena sp. lw0831]